MYYRKQKSDYLPDLLDQNDDQDILKKLNISWTEHTVNCRWWVVLSSPFRDDLIPSFSLNVRKGCFTEIGRTGMIGDIADLVSLSLKITRKSSRRWIIVNSILNLRNN